MIRVSRAASPVRHSDIKHATGSDRIAVPLVRLSARVIADAAASSGLKFHIFIFHL